MLTELFYFAYNVKHFVTGILTFICFFLFRESASLSMWARQVSRQEMPAGSSSALSTASVLMASSWRLRQSQTLVMTPSTPSSILGALGVMFQERYMWTWSPQLLVSSPVCVFIFTLLISIISIYLYFFYIHSRRPVMCGRMCLV